MDLLFLTAATMSVASLALALFFTLKSIRTGRIYRLSRINGARGYAVKRSLNLSAFFLFITLMLCFGVFQNRYYGSSPAGSRVVAASELARVSYIRVIITVSAFMLIQLNDWRYARRQIKELNNASLSTPKLDGPAVFVCNASTDVKCRFRGECGSVYTISPPDAGSETTGSGI